jgi:hypothetical protein
MHHKPSTTEGDESAGSEPDSWPASDFLGRIEGLRWMLRRARARGLTREEWQAATALALSLLTLLDEPSIS